MRDDSNEERQSRERMHQFTGVVTALDKNTLTEKRKEAADCGLPDMPR
jgi:hypothetical protein